MDLSENVCICCAMPSVNSLIFLNRRTITSVAVRAVDAYEICCGPKISKFPTPLRINPKICSSCLVQLELSFKFYDRCQQTRTAFDFSSAKYSACRGCSCPDFMDTKLCNMEEQEFSNNEECVKCIDAYLEFFEVGKSEGEVYKICQSCLSDLETAFLFRAFCQHAFKILNKKYQKKTSAELPTVIGFKSEVVEIKEEEPSEGSYLDNQETPVDRQRKKRKGKVKLETDLSKTANPPSSSSIQCDICLTSYAHRKSLKNHLKLHSSNPNFISRKRKKPEREYKCDKCPCSFVNRKDIRVHMKRHMSKVITDKTHLCIECGQLFAMKRQLDLHMDTHRTEKFACSHCPSTYLHKKHLQRHLILHTSATGERDGCEKCSKCKRSFKIENMADHMKNVHTNEKPHSCNVCATSFTKKIELFRHSFDHLDFLPYYCPEMDKNGTICDFSTKMKRIFKNHLMMKHNVEYSETIHGYSETKSKAMKELHERSLNKSTNYRCEECSKCFQTMTGLHHHRRTGHLKVGFTCRLCDKTYTQKQTLWSHSFLHRNFAPFNCTEYGCSYKINIKQDFKVHLKKEHNIDYKEDVHGYKGESFQQAIELVLNPTKLDSGAS